MAVMIRPIGFAAMTAFRPAIAVFTPAIAVVTVGIIVIIVPTAEITLPTITSTGPIAAATSAIFTIICCIGSPRLFHHSARDFSLSESSLRTGARTDIRELPTSAPVSFREFMVIWNWSIGSSVSLKVFSTLPSKSPRKPEKSDRLSFPVCTAL